MSDDSSIKILFVCFGNTCRSPMAEAIFKELAKKQNVDLKFEVGSAGISAWQAGQDPNDFVKTILNRNGIPFEHSARQITIDDFKKFDYMFGMDNYNIHELNNYAESLSSKTKVRLLRDYYSENDKIIVDPYFDNRREDFEKCFVQISESCANLLTHLMQA